MNYRQALAVAALLLGGIQPIFAQSGPPSASIHGVVFGDDGRPLKGAYVGSTASGRNLRQPTQEDGAFSLTNLDGGQHGLCIQVPGTIYLDPCRWSTPTTINLNRGQTRAAVRIQLQKGFRMVVHIDDPAGELQRNQAQATNQLLVGVFDQNGLFQRATLISRYPSRWTYALVVPFETALHLSITSRLFKLADSDGKELGASADGLPFKISATGQQPPFSFRIVGVSKQ